MDYLTPFKTKPKVCMRTGYWLNGWRILCQLLICSFTVYRHLYHARLNMSSCSVSRMHHVHFGVFNEGRSEPPAAFSSAWRLAASVLTGSVASCHSDSFDSDNVIDWYTYRHVCVEFRYVVSCLFGLHNNGWDRTWTTRTYHCFTDIFPDLGNPAWNWDNPGQHPYYLVVLLADTIHSHSLEKLA